MRGSLKHSELFSQGVKKKKDWIKKWCSKRRRRWRWKKKDVTNLFPPKLEGDELAVCESQ